MFKMNKDLTRHSSLSVSWIAKMLLTLMTCFMTSYVTAQRNQERQCQPITIPMCKGIGYNFTYMPNQFNDQTQEEAGLEVHQFWPLVEINCSTELRFFLCSMYTPICMETYNKPLPACRSLCERAKSGCAPIMLQYGFQWPERMSCDSLPEFGDPENLCMADRTQQQDEKDDASPKKDKNDRPGGSGGGGKKGGIFSIATTPEIDSTPFFDTCHCECRFVTLQNSSHPMYGEVWTGFQENCAMTCKVPYFSDEEMHFATIWLAVWSILCLISTFVTVITFCVDMKRFQYPERPIIFLGGCYAMISLGFIIRLVLGHEKLACDTGEDDISIIRYETNGPAWCTIVFLLIYFFGMASSMWWVILSLTWFLAAGLKWGQEAIASYSHYFHLAAWLIPSVKSILILALKLVDGDPISGICYVGNQSITNLRIFVIIPLCVYLLVGTTFLVAGFISLFRIRTAIRQQGRGKTEKLEKLMIRIGVFSVLYTVPATAVIACYIYEQRYRMAWEFGYNCPCNAHIPRPYYYLFILKYFMCLVVGITSGFWVWSGKTIDSWARCYHTVCCCKSGDTYQAPPPTHGRVLHIKYPSPPLSNNASYQSVKNTPYSHV